MTSRDTRRAFTQTQRNEILYQQDNKCAKCHERLDPRATEFDHVKPWVAQGRTVTQNGAALCLKCHGIKTHYERLKAIDSNKADTKPAPALALEKLSTKQLKYLADKHGIKLRGKTVGDMLESHRQAPTKKQYITKLSGIVTNNELGAVPKEAPKPVKKRKATMSEIDRFDKWLGF